MNAAFTKNKENLIARHLENSKMKIDPLQYYFDSIRELVESVAPLYLKELNDALILFSSVIAFNESPVMVEARARDIAHLRSYSNLLNANGKHSCFQGALSKEQREILQQRISENSTPRILPLTLSLPPQNHRVLKLSGITPHQSNSCPPNQGLLPQGVSR